MRLSLSIIMGCQINKATHFCVFRDKLCKYKNSFIISVNQNIKTTTMAIALVRNRYYNIIYIILTYITYK